MLWSVYVTKCWEEMQSRRSSIQNTRIHHVHSPWMHIHQQQQARNSQPRTICKQIKLTIHSLEEQFIINANAVCIERGRQSSHQRTSSGLQGAQPLKLSSTRDVPQLASLTTTLATGSSITASSNLKHILNPIKLSNPFSSGDKSLCCEIMAEKQHLRFQSQFLLPPSEKSTQRRHTRNTLKGNVLYT